MSSIVWFRHLARNDAWSNERLHAACARLSEAEYVAKRTSFFPSIPLTLWHLLLVGEYYLDALLGGGRGYAIDRDLEPLKAAPHEVLRAAQRELDQRTIAFVDLAGEHDLARAVKIDRGERFDTEPVGAVLMHLFTHQIHHRGQVHAMLSGTSVAPPQLDEYFLDVDRPTAERELVAAGIPLVG